MRAVRRNWLKAAGYFSIFEAVWLVVVPVLHQSEAGSWWPAWRSPGLVAVGAALAVGGAALTLVAHHDLIALGAGTPLPIRPPTRLVTTGVYGLVRNPAGLGLIGLTAGVALAADVAAVWLLPLVAAVYVVGVQAPGEKVQLTQRFGDEYGEYRSAVPGWLPRM